MFFPASRLCLYQVIFLSIAVHLCMSMHLPLTPAPVPDCASLQDIGSVPYMLHSSLAHVVCGYAAYHQQVSQGDSELRALVFSPGKHQLGNRVLELATVMLLCMCERPRPNFKTAFAY